VLTFDVVSSNQVEIDQDNKKKQLPPAPENMSEEQNKIRENWSLSLEGMRNDVTMGYTTTVFEPNGTYSNIYGSTEKELVKQIEDYYMGQLEGLKKPKTKPAPTTSVSELKTKKADIERRRKAELDSVQEVPKSKGILGKLEGAFAQGKYQYQQINVQADGKGEFTTYKFGDSIEDLKKEIDAHYNAELVKELFKEMKAGKTLLQFTPAEQKILDNPAYGSIREEVFKESVTQPAAPTDLANLLDTSIDFGDIAEDIGDVEEPPTGTPLRSVKTTLEEFKKTCD